MIIEKDIGEIPGVVIEDDVYLLARSSFDDRKDRLSCIPTVDILVDGDHCPYCGAPPISPYHGCRRPGSWAYRRFACGVMAASRLGTLLAISRQSDVCRMFSQNVETDDVI